MNFLTPNLAVLLLCIAVNSNADGGSPSCKQSDKVILQVLGSGGPIADDGRSSTGYLVWINGHSRFMIDTGGGTFLRFGEAGARFEDLSLIAISHFHTDHSSDLAAILKSGYFSERTKNLAISGPGGDGAYPPLDEFLARLLGSDQGAYAYLAGYLDGGDGLGDGHCVGGVEGVGPDEDDVGHALFAAMAQGLGGVAQGIGCIFIRHLHVMQILSGGHGPHLEDIESPLMITVAGQVD